MRKRMESVYKWWSAKHVWVLVLFIVIRNNNNLILFRCMLLISFLFSSPPNKTKTVKWKCSLLSLVWLFATPSTVAHQALLSIGFFRQEYWSGLPFPFLGYHPNPGIKPTSPALQTDSLPFEPPRSPIRPKSSPFPNTSRECFLLIFFSLCRKEATKSTESFVEQRDWIPFLPTCGE